MAKVYLSLGSNVGNQQKFLNNALDALKTHIRWQVISSTYKTAPWGNEDQPSFLNLCAEGETDLAPEELLAFIKSTESKLGRTHIEKWGPREIDIDILFYGDETIKADGLEIPHPHLGERAFVLIPLAEIAPKLIHPTLNKTISELEQAIDHGGVTKDSGQ